jgi:hypothetical protein
VGRNCLAGFKGAFGRRRVRYRSSRHSDYLPPLREYIEVIADGDFGDAEPKAQLWNADKLARPDQREQLLPAPTGAPLIVRSQLRVSLPNLAAPLSAENTKLVK